MIGLDDGQIVSLSSLPHTAIGTCVSQARLNILPPLNPFTTGVHAFLKEMSSLFCVYLYTMGSREYVQQALRHLDPTHAIFRPGQVCPLMQPFSRGGAVTLRPWAGGNTPALPAPLSSGRECSRRSDISIPRTPSSDPDMCAPFQPVAPLA